MAARHEQRFYEKTIFMHVLVCKALSNDGVRVAGENVFHEIRPVPQEMESKPAISLKNSWGGYRRTIIS